MDARVYLPALLLASGCGLIGLDRHFDESSERTALCVHPEGMVSEPFLQPPAVEYPPDGAVDIQVRYTGCLSRSCDTERKSSCSVTRDGETLIVEADFSWFNQGNTCTSDCGRLAATCRTEPLPAGTYTVRFGDRTTTLQVGMGNVERPCIGSDP